MGQVDFVSESEFTIRFVGQFVVANCEEDVVTVINGTSRQNRILFWRAR